MSIRRPCDKLITVPPNGKGMRTAIAASVEPAGREEMFSVARSKHGSARALLKRESVNPACFEARALLKRELECCSDRPEKVNCQPGLFGRGMFREATQAIRCGMVSQRHGKFRERHV